MNLFKLRGIIILFILCISCISEQKTIELKEYPRHVDDISFDYLIDNKNFELCNGENNIMQYFNNGKGLEYEGEKISIIREFKKYYNSENVVKESGLLRIRFVVNCKGEADRYRFLSMDLNYNEKKFDKSIIDQILTITKKLKGWKPKVYAGKKIDYYQYLIFKLNNGEIVKILP